MGCNSAMCLGVMACISKALRGTQMKKELLILMAGSYPACLAGCCLLALIAGEPAYAINPRQIVGDWQNQTQNVCLYAPGGFNAQLRPNNPAES